jgi:hypothetical protein
MIVWKKKTSKSTPHALVSLFHLEPSPIHAMKGYWCVCNRCNGGKVVGKTAWYLHNPRETQTPMKTSLRPGRSSTLSHRDKFPDVGSKPMGNDANRSLGDLEPPGDPDQTSLSEFVSVICLSNRCLLITFRTGYIYGRWGSGTSKPSANDQMSESRPSAFLGSVSGSSPPSFSS